MERTQSASKLLRGYRWLQTRPGLFHNMRCSLKGIDSLIAKRYSSSREVYKEALRLATFASRHQYSCDLKSRISPFNKYINKLISTQSKQPFDSFPGAAFNSVCAVLALETSTGSLVLTVVSSQSEIPAKDLARTPPPNQPPVSSLSILGLHTDCPSFYNFHFHFNFSHFVFDFTSILTFIFYFYH